MYMVAGTTHSNLNQWRRPNFRGILLEEFQSRSIINCLTASTQHMYTLYIEKQKDMAVNLLGASPKTPSKKHVHTLTAADKCIRVLPTHCRGTLQDSKVYAKLFCLCNVSLPVVHVITIETIKYKQMTNPNTR